jgi:hypothetical protein
VAGGAAAAAAAAAADVLFRVAFKDESGSKRVEPAVVVPSLKISCCISKGNKLDFFLEGR